MQCGACLPLVGFDRPYVLSVNLLVSYPQERIHQQERTQYHQGKPVSHLTLELERVVLVGVELRLPMTVVDTFLFMSVCVGGVENLSVMILFLHVVTHLVMVECH